MAGALSAGVGGAVLVEGEQGIGKTELLRVGLAGASGYRLVWGAADELGQPVPLTLVRQCLADVDAAPPGGSPVAGRVAGCSRAIRCSRRWKGFWRRWTGCARSRRWCWRVFNLLCKRGPEMPV
jgi:hypothetical protein